MQVLPRVQRAGVSLLTSTSIARCFGTSIPVVLMTDLQSIKSVNADEYAPQHTYSQKRGDIITVKRGYARNFLIPRCVRMAISLTFVTV